MHVLVVDTGHANLTSVCRALQEAAKQTSSSVRVESSRDPDIIRRADKLVVPGQGGFQDCARALQDEIEEALREQKERGTYYLGICLGLQALLDSSEEAPGQKGLGFVPGTNQKLTPSQGIKIPHMGWNQLHLEHGGHPILQDAGGEGSWVYFVHSYHAQPEDPTVIKATVQHGPHTVTAAIMKENLLGTQFHPEKSQATGLRLLAGFLRL